MDAIIAEGVVKAYPSRKSEVVSIAIVAPLGTRRYRSLSR